MKRSSVRFLDNINRRTIKPRIRLTNLENAPEREKIIKILCRQNWAHEEGPIEILLDYLEELSRYILLKFKNGAVFDSSGFERPFLVNSECDWLRLCVFINETSRLEECHCIHPTEESTDTTKLIYLLIYHPEDVWVKEIESGDNPKAYDSKSRTSLLEKLVPNKTHNDPSFNCISKNLWFDRFDAIPENNVEIEHPEIKCNYSARTATASILMRFFGKK